MDEKKDNKKMVKGMSIGIGIVVVVILAIALFKNGLPFGNLSQKDAAAKAEKFVNSELLAGQGGATLKIVGTEGNLYKLEVTYQGRKIDSYMTKDGKKFFPQVFDMATSTVAAAASSADDAAAPVTEAPKSGKPVVELFVMSYCPYGTQIEKGMLPVVATLGNKIDFKLKFVSYTMHGEKENTENLRQYCIDKGQNSKLANYLTCFLKASDSAGCLKSTGVDEGKVASCMADGAKNFDITGTNFSVHKADNEKYGVQGSPTLVINGATISAGRDSASLLKAVCGAFNNAPSECSKELSSAAPAPGFGEGTAPASAGSAAAGCATN